MPVATCISSIINEAGFGQVVCVLARPLLAQFPVFRYFYNLPSLLALVPLVQEAHLCRQSKSFRYAWIGGVQIIQVAIYVQSMQR